MSSVNKVILLGRLGKDPELKYTPNGAAVCKFSLATSKSWVGKDGNKNDQTEWHNIVVWNKLAENCAKYLAKGRQAYVEGEIQSRSWEDQKTGQKHYATDIVASNITFISSSQNNQQPASSQQLPYEGSPINPDEIPF